MSQGMFRSLGLCQSAYFYITSDLLCKLFNIPLLGISKAQRGYIIEYFLDLVRHKEISH